jgi:hypothetical protein
MLDETIHVEKKEASDYKPLPDDMYQVELLDVVSEMRPTYDTRLKPDNEKEYEAVFNFQFTVLEDGEFDGKPLRGRNIWYNFVPSYLYIGKNGKNALYQIVEAFQGQSLSPEQEAMGITGKYINDLIGKQCRVVTKQKTKGEKTFMNIESLLPAKTLLAALDAKEKEDARVKPKDASDKKAEADYAGEDPTEADVPFEG